MKRNRSSTRYAVLLLLIAVLFGCKKEEQKAAPATPAAKPPAKTAPSAAPVQKQLSSVAGTGNRLDFRNRTDPFKPYGPVAAPTEPGRQPSAVPSADALPIQSFEVEKFKLVGVITGLRENRAQVIDPNGKAYVVQRGMLIGNNNGRISRITANSVEVVESFKDDRGRTRKRTIVLTLAKKR